MVERQSQEKQHAALFKVLSFQFDFLEEILRLSARCSCLEPYQEVTIALYVLTDSTIKTKSTSCGQNLCP